MDAPPITSLFMAITNWALAHGARNLSQKPGCWEHEWAFDGMPASVAINGSDEERKTSGGMTLPRYSALVEINGWPAFLGDPSGGVIMFAEPDSEDRLIAAFEADTEPKA